MTNNFSVFEPYICSQIITKIFIDTETDNDNDVNQITSLLSHKFNLPLFNYADSADSADALLIIGNKNLDKARENKFNYCLFINHEEKELSNIAVKLSKLAETYFIYTPSLGNFNKFKSFNYDVSVIIPVYGVEEYIVKCVESLINQDFKGKYEAIFVNDGTKDNSAELINEKIKNYPYIKLINKPNGGAADARNFGINYSSGEYICFVDGDDYVSSDYISTLYEIIKDSQTDISQASFSYVENSNKIETYNEDIIKTEKDNISNCQIASSLSAMRNVPGIWRKIYRRSFIISNNLFFEKKFRRHDDLPFNINTLLSTKKVAVSKKNVYKYIIGRPGQDVSATDERMFIHFRLFDDVFIKNNIKDLNKSDYSLFLKVLFSHHLWAFNRIENKYRKKYLIGFSYQLYNTPGKLGRLSRLNTLKEDFPNEIKLIFKLLILSYKNNNKDKIITDLNYKKTNH